MDLLYYLGITASTRQLSNEERVALWRQRKNIRWTVATVVHIGRMK